MTGSLPASYMPVASSSSISLRRLRTRFTAAWASLGAELGGGLLVSARGGLRGRKTPALASINSPKHKIEQ
jgi:hypothetical protein